MSARPAVNPRANAAAIARALRQAGHVAYFAGGCVRDELLGLTPKDYDIATDAPPLRVQELFPRTQAVGAAFGVVLVRQDGSTVEVATFRADANYSDGRRPDAVRFTDAREDAQRRDFTINGLFLDPADETLIDHVNGREDLDRRVLRAIGDADARFAEDHLRLLRGVRFAARFDLAINPATAHAIQTHAVHLARISPERIAGELRLMLAPPTRGRAASLLHELSLMPVLTRFLAETSPCRIVLLASLGDKPATFGLAMAAMILAHRDIRWPLPIRKDAAAMRKTLRISNVESDELRACLEAGAMLDEGERSIAQLKRFAATEHADVAMRLLRALAACGQYTQRAEQLDHSLAALTDIAPTPLLTGDHLLAAGHTAGPRFKRVLHDVYDAQLEGQLTTTEQAEALAFELLKH